MKQDLLSLLLSITLLSVSVKEKETIEAFELNHVP